MKLIKEEKFNETNKFNSIDLKSADFFILFYEGGLTLTVGDMNKRRGVCSCCSDSISSFDNKQLIGYQAFSVEYDELILNLRQVTNNKGVFLADVSSNLKAFNLNEKEANDLINVIKTRVRG